jgi:hypothetical protein
MKTTSLLSLLLLFLFACNEPIVREAPVEPNRVVSLGFYPFTSATNSFTPYFYQSTLVFTDENDTEYTFRMTQPIIQSEFGYLRTFPDAEKPGSFIDYRYAGNHAIFEFVSNELGARLSVSLSPDFCEDPQLNDEDFPRDQLQVKGIGFNDGDVAIREPALAILTQSNQPCRQGRQLGNITLRGQTFTNVTRDRQSLGDRYLEVYHSPEDGIVALRTSYMFLTLKEAY